MAAAATAATPILASSLIARHEIGLYTAKARQRIRVASTCSAVDEALSGGLVYGTDGVYNICGDAGSLAVEGVTLQLLITHLLSSAAHTATLIDATGNFDVLKLYRCITSRLSKRHPDKHESNVRQATSALDRVKIMRVFDFEGMIEGLNELVEGLEGKEVGEEIGDSEGEEEMLLEFSEEEKESKQAAGMVLINNLSQVLGLLLKNDYARGQATLATLIRKLRTTATQHDICVVLLSWSVTYTNDHERVSAFQDIKARPGLGKSLGYLVDTQILVDSVAKPGSSNDFVNVIEVISSKGSHQAGKFGVFDVSPEGEITPGILRRSLEKRA